MKLTKEMVNDLHRHASTSELFEAIELHTAECVAEAVAEVKKTHYQLGEPLQLRCRDDWTNGTVAIVNGLPEEWKSENSQAFRRPPHTRTKTTEELRHDVSCKLLCAVALLKDVSRHTLESMARDLGVPIEVEEV